MRDRSIPFVVGLLLVGAAFAVTPMFVTRGPLLVSGNPATDASWDISQPMTWDLRIPMLLAASGVTVLVIAMARMRRTRTR